MNIAKPSELLLAVMRDNEVRRNGRPSLQLRFKLLLEPVAICNVQCLERL